MSGHPKFKELTEEEIKLHDAKNEDYSKGGNPLGNFYRVSEVLTSMGFPISPTMVCVVYAMKQLDAAVHMLTQGYEGQVENVDTRLQDVHVYFKLARILHMESQENIPSQPPQNYYYSIEDFPWYQGMTIPVESCPECKGEGYLYTVCGSSSGMMDCPRCNGAKVIPII